MSLILHDLDGQLRAWPATDRAWQFGDGVFRTGRVEQGQVDDLAGQLTHLLGDARKLALSPLPAPEALAQASQRIAQGHKHARIKWVISAGDSFGGYARAGEPRTLIALSPLNASWRPPQHVPAWICHTRLQAAGDWAGAKHLNRLENVMARRERAPSDCVEGLMCDAHGQLACGVSSNLFWRDRQGRLCTHPLDDCGVRGRTRARILAAAEAQGEAVRFVAERVADVLAEACELVAVNSLWGALSIDAVDDWRAQGRQTEAWMRELLHRPPRAGGA